MPKVLFTPDNARQMSAKGLEAKRAIRSAELARLALIDRLLEQAAQTPALPKDQAETNAYLVRRVKRVRKQIDRLSDMLDHEDDPAKLDRIASALERLDEIERRLDGRPTVGTLKPQQPGQSPKSSPVEPSPVRPVSATLQRGEPATPAAPTPPSKPLDQGNGPLLSEPPDL